MAKTTTKKAVQKRKSATTILSVPSKELLDYVKFFNKNNLAELTIKEHGTTISLKRETAGQVVMQTAVAPVVETKASPAQASASTQPSAPKDDDAGGHEKITSPIIGTFYEAPAPDKPPFVTVGKTVKEGDTLCIVEAMKVMNKITADFPCKIVKRIGENGKPVKAGDTLFLVDKV